MILNLFLHLAIADSKIYLKILDNVFFCILILNSFPGKHPLGPLAAFYIALLANVPPHKFSSGSATGV